MTIFLSLLVALIGLLCYVLASNPKVQELGRITWGCGLVAFLLKVAEPLINILGR
jgi:Na+/phosphate symporter